MKDYPKYVKRLLRELAPLAYDRELDLELSKLDARFAEWRSGHISGSELNEHIHNYHNGASREIWSFYFNGEPDLVVAYAIVAGLLERDETPEEVLAALELPIAFHQETADRGELRIPGK